MRSLGLLFSLFTALLCLAPFQLSAESTPLVIGVDADLSAVAVEGGVAITRGVELAAEEINASGGILGRPVRVVVKDHRGNPARGIHHLNQLAENENLLAVVSGVHTPVLLEEIETIHKKDILMLVPWAAGTPIIDNGMSPNNVFRISVRDAEAAKVLLKHAAEKKLRSVALVLERTGWGRSNLESLQKSAKEIGIEIKGVHWINWQQKHFSEDINAIKDAAVDGIILVTNVPEAAVVLEEMNNHMLLDLPIISHWGIASGQLTERLTTPIDQYDIAVLQTFHFNHQKNDRAKHLYERYVSQYGLVEPNAIEGVTGLAHAYDLVHLIATAADKAGSIEIDALRRALESLETFEGAVKTYAPPFTKDRHDALWSKDYFMTTFNKKGQLVTSGQ